MQFNLKQIKMALACIGWTERDLANAIGMDDGNLSKILTGKVSPRAETQRKLIRMLEDNGAEFTADSGVRPRITDIQVYEGLEGWKAFSDDRYQTALNSNQDFLSCGGIQDAFTKAAGADYQKWNVERMKSIPHFHLRALRPLSYTTPQVASYVEYRAVPDEQFPKTSFYVYGGKLALLRFEPNIRIYVIQDREVSESYRTQFEMLWSNARPLRPADA